MNFTVDELALLSHLTRWQNVATFKRESVAEHTAQVALLVVRLAEYLDFDLGNALLIAVLHDCQEVETTDIPANVSAKFPELAAAKRAAELRINSERLPSYKELLEQPSVELSVVKLADALQVVQFARSELRLSETARMLDVLASAKGIAEDLAGKLKLDCKLLQCLLDGN